MGPTEAPAAGDGMGVADSLSLVDPATPPSELSLAGEPGWPGGVGGPSAERPDDAPPDATRPLSDRPQHPDPVRRPGPDEALAAQERERRREAVIHHLEQARRRRRPHQAPFS